MKLRHKILLPVLAAAAIAVGLAGVPATPAHALMITKPEASGADFGPIPPRIDLPQGKEELSKNDIRHAVEAHLTTIGALDLKVGKIDKTADGIAIVHIVNGQDDPVGEFGVDVATAEIFPQSQLEVLLGKGSPDNCASANFAGLLSGDKTLSSYRLRLRAHMMGDGQAWAPWLSAAAASASACQGDYKDGGPKIPLHKEIF